MTQEDAVRADQLTLQNYLWERRGEVTEWLVLHECLASQAHAAAIRLAGWDRATFIVATVMDSRELLDA